MTEEERRFKVVKIDKYKDQISAEDKRAIKDQWLVLFTSILAIKFYSAKMAYPTVDSTVVILNYLGTISWVTSLGFLKGMITAISKKTALELKAEELIEEIESYDFEDEKSKGAR